MVKRQSRREHVGKVSKLPFHQWITHIFQHNEIFDQKLTDLDIVNSAAAEFSRRLATIRLLITTPGKLGTERARYNKASKTCLLSLRYNERQFPISGSGSAAMSLSEIREKCFHYKKIDPRFFTTEEINWIETQKEDGTNSEFSPRQTKIYGISEKKNFILHTKFDEYKERNSSLIVSMIPKGDHHLVYNFEHHPIQFNMMKKENYFFISEEHSDHILILHNNNNYNKAKFSIHFTDFDFSKSNFWGPGGVGFFFSLLLFITGLVLLILSYLLYKKYRQNKSYKLLSENIAGSDSKELKSSNV